MPTNCLASVLEAAQNVGDSLKMLRWFDATKPYSVRRGELPHWWQIGCTTFITFRTHDAIPTAVHRRICNDRDRWLREHTRLPPQATPHEMMEQLSAEQQTDVRRRFAAAFESALDLGHGACPLRRMEAARIVADALHHADGLRYELADYVVMPNHVHALIVPIQDFSPADICWSWKRYTARELNKLLGTSGTFWQGESFDHLVRSPEHFLKYRRYIHDNPRKAGLPPGDFLLGCGRALSDPLP